MRRTTSRAPAPDAPDDITRARAAGASGYVTKDQVAGDLVRAILGAVGR